MLLKVAVRILRLEGPVKEQSARLSLVRFLPGATCGSRFAEGVSLGSPVFLPPQKPTFTNSNSTGTEDLPETSF